MDDFPRTNIEALSVSRMLIGINWFLGFTHQTRAKDRWNDAYMTRARVADVIVAFAEAGVDTLYGVLHDRPKLIDAIEQAQDRIGRKIITMGTPHLNLDGTAEAAGENARLLDAQAGIGLSVCLPHQATTDRMLDRRRRCLPGMDEFCRMIRERGMIPGLSTHAPETPVYADESGLDVATYIQPYNAAGFLMQIEVDWVHRMIWQRQRAVIAIKPLAAGRLPPLVGLAFCWSTLRPQDMVCVGTMSPDEAKEVVEISWSLFENRATGFELQRTRSKAAIDGR
jgi:hypothetical protein